MFFCENVNLSTINSVMFSLMFFNLDNDKKDKDLTQSQEHEI